MKFRSEEVHVERQRPVMALLDVLIVHACSGREKVRY